MKSSLRIIFFITACSTILSAQSVSGNMSLLANQSIKLEGFQGLKNYLIDSVAIDASGNFKLAYSHDVYGVGYLMSADKKAFFVILSGADIEVVGEALSYT